MKNLQTKKASLIESIISNLFGFLLTIIAQYFFFTNQTLVENLSFSTILLGLHIIRSYLVRRGFNQYTLKKARKRKAKKHVQRRT